uniref:Uncharacterized protein n=1 Tax=Anguilla anguilla TaxID=7936 RepID=A0A0E9QLN7_ANGAN
MSDILFGECYRMCWVSKRGSSGHTLYP